MASFVSSLLSGGAGTLLDGVSKVINSIKGKSPEDAAKLEQLKTQYAAEFAQAQLDMQKQQMQIDAQQNQAQADINKIEAASGDKFERDWRPLVGYICALGLGVQFIVRPFALFFSALAGKHIDFPVLDLGTLLTLLFGMLGLGYYKHKES